MQVWIRQTSAGRFHGPVHRESAGDCSVLLESGAEGDEIELVDIEEVPARQPACQSTSCFAGVERAGQLLRTTPTAEPVFEPFEPTRRVRLKPATKGSRPRTRTRASGGGKRKPAARPAAPAAPPPPPERLVSAGSVVTFRFLDSGETKTLTLVEGIADRAAGEMSIETPFGKAMAGADEGDRVTAELPAGKRELEIIEFSVPWED